MTAHDFLSLSFTLEPLGTWCTQVSLKSYASSRLSLCYCVVGENVWDIFGKFFALQHMWVLEGEKSGDLTLFQNRFVLMDNNLGGTSREAVSSRDQTWVFISLFFFILQLGKSDNKKRLPVFLHSAARWLALLPLLETSDFWNGSVPFLLPKGWKSCSILFVPLLMRFWGFLPSRSAEKKTNRHQPGVSDSDRWSL